MSVRAFPMPTFPTSRPVSWCRWCGEGPIIYHEGKKAGEPNLRRGWHDGRGAEPSCLLEYYLHTRREDQFAHVAERDGLKCWGCDGEPMKWLRGLECVQPVYDERYRVLFVARFCSVERKTALELEHTRPLWLTAHLPDDERRPFFGPTNLRLLCRGCHKKKTAREAGERAKGNRLIASAAGETKPKRKIAGRAFDKTKTRRMNGTVVPRR